ncbi:MAG: MFS transporter [Bacillota bacterium]
MKNKYFLKTLALSFVPLIMVLGNSMLIPVFTDIKRELGINQLQASLLISYFSYAAALCIPFLGFLSDRIGRKKILIPSLMIYGIGGGISGLSSIFSSDPYSLILVGRIIQGIGAAGTSPIAMAMISDMFTDTERSKALGMIEASNGIGKIISPILGSLIAVIAWYLIFFSYSILTIPAAVLIWYIIKEEGSHGEQKPLGIYFKEIHSLVGKKGLSIVLCFLTAFIGLFALYGILSNITDFLHIGNKSKLIHKGFIVAFPLLLMSIFSFWSGAYLKKKVYLFKKSVVISLLLCSLAIFLIPRLASFPQRMMIVVVISIAVGVVLTCLNTLVTSSVPPGKRGVITAFYNSFRFLGIASGPVFFSNPSVFRGKAIILAVLIIFLSLLFHLFVKSEELLEYFSTKKNI